MRVLEIAKKIRLKENEYVKSRLSEWVEKSNSYADMMIERYGFNEVQNTREGYRLLFIMNKVCPNLHHFCKMPNFSIRNEDDLREWNEMVGNHTRENSQAGFVDSDGTLVQEGIHYTKEEFNAFVETVKDLI